MSEAVTRKEMYLRNMVGKGNRPTKPITRKEKYLEEIALMLENGTGTGGGGANGGGSVESWRLLYDATISENVSNVEITQDMDGNTFKLKKLYFALKVVNNASNGSPYMYFYLKGTESFLAWNTPDGPGKGTQYAKGLAEVLGDGHIITYEVGKISNNLQPSNNGLGKAYIPYITGFKIAGYSSNTMDSVEMKVYGVDA